MANGKAQVTDLDLSNISVNLTDYLSDIRNYEGFVQCNSPYIGGLLNNVYRKKIVNEDGHNIIRIHNGHIYSLFGGAFYIDGEKYSDIDTHSFVLEEYKDKYVKELDTKIVVNFNGKILEKTHDLDFSYDYVLSADEQKLSFASAQTTASSYSEFLANLSYYEITSSSITTKLGSLGSVIISGAVLSVSTLSGLLSNNGISTSNIIHVQYDASGMIFETASDFATLYRKKDGTFAISKVANVCKSALVSYWTKGEKIKTSFGFDTLYYNKFISGISYNNSVLTYDVDRIIRVTSDYIVYGDSSGKKWKISIKDNDIPVYTVDDDFIYFNTIDYNNTYSFASEKLLCRSDDYNDRVLMTGATGDTGLYVSSYKSNAQVMNYESFSTIYASTSMKLGSSFSQPFPNDMVHPVEIFLPETAGGAAVYKYTIIFGGYATYDTTKELSLDGTTFPVDETANQLYNTPVLMKISDTYINEKVGSYGDYSYILAKSQRQENILGYYEFTLSEIKDIFLVQGSFYGVTDKYIFSLSVENSNLSINNVVANKLDLQFLGAFPTMALFYSKLDKSIYSFTGDATLTKLKEAYRINNIYSTYCDPSRLTMIISTNIGTLIVYQNQTILLDDLYTKNAIYYDGNSYIVGDYMLSLSYKEEFEISPIRLLTGFYGVGSNTKSINDCVYIRLAKNTVTKGYIKLKSYTFTDKTVGSAEKRIDLIDTNFDKLSESFFIRYQPQNQTGVGFSLEIESTNPIISISIGHTPEGSQVSRVSL